METTETKLNDSCPLGRELDTDELENVSGGEMIPGLSNMVRDAVGNAVGGAIDKQLYEHYPALVLRGMVNPKVPYFDGKMRECGFWEARFERAPSIDGLKRLAEETSRQMSNTVKRKDKIDVALFIDAMSKIVLK